MPPLTYEVTPADRRPLPPSWAVSSRRGYDAAEARLPFARFFSPEPSPLPRATHDLLQAPGGARLEAAQSYGLDDVVTRLSRPGYDCAETGWATRPDGTTYVACLTSMPGVSAAMWDWWFGWHSNEPARYKLWHPQAHEFCAWGDDRTADRSLSDRQRYVGNVSYVDEWIGPTRQRLAIRFVDPRSLGFADVPGTTHVCARVGFSHLPLAFGWLVHQVRPTSDGCEMRSRFFLNHVAGLTLGRAALAPTVGARVVGSTAARAVLGAVPPQLSRAFLPRGIGADLLEHCAVEMHHLSTFLPQLHAEFAGTA